MRRGLMGAALFSVATLATGEASAAGPPLLVQRAGASARDLQRVTRIARSLRALRPALSWPKGQSRSQAQAAAESRGRAIRLSLDRARRLEAEVDFEGCVREAARVLSDATETLAAQNDFIALRDLHVQIGACLAMAGQAASARPHFLSAALLDESPPRIGLHREEAEAAQLAARHEILQRARGKVRVQTQPPGASVWIDGKRARGVTPLTVTIRTGDHFVTLRRFRYEPLTTKLTLQPSGKVSLALDPARRTTLQQQLVAATKGNRPAGALRLARAQWSRAEQLLELRRGKRNLELVLLEVPSGAVVRRAQVLPGASDEQLKRSLCRVLAEPCPKESGGTPWYVWPLAGAVLVGGTVTTLIVLDNNRDQRFCPAGGCRD